MTIQWQWDQPHPFDLVTVLRLVQLSNCYKSLILIGSNSTLVDCKEVSQAVSFFLIAKQDQPLHIKVEGEDASEAFVQIIDYIAVAADYISLTVQKEGKTALDSIANSYIAPASFRMVKDGRLALRSAKVPV
ncbi:HPr family phosphocarrier protein [Paenibacillus radicis (ex Xue et al. 2023)]|uniref:HPr domain-containing protein n=1 Tax=Paenibacillus radicis (ex Xue et al. 2023) TaxID=2972489 RepID=A0ABT1Y9Y3_9BACL|nr:HPr family phosphocarrier protein [Paenibacillus radicis (ex Xue et al. 2023)]MCR8630006.1 hypothetical protein [Paenibacillus radicis (ex Xue et al. 2023)]